MIIKVTVIYSTIGSHNNNFQDMNLVHLSVALLVLSSQAAVVLNPISGITSNNLMYTGTIGVNNEKLFFTFYGKDGETNPDNLNQNVLLIGMGSPGRSAQYMNVAGLGPKVLNPQLYLIDNSNAATQFANIMFVDLLGSGFSFASSPGAIPKTSQDYGVMITKAINSFIAQTNIGKSKSVYILAESTFLRVLPGLDDINPLKGIVHVSGWFDLYGTGKYYGTGGVELKIFTDSQRITIDSTYSNCYNFQRSSKFNQSHACYDTTLNYIQSKTKNRNLYNIQLVSNLTEFLPLTQYYFSQSSVVNAYKAPSTPMFETQAAQVQTNLYEDLARNIDANISQYLKDDLAVRHLFISGDDDFIVYRKGTRNWLENSISFVESSKFKPLNLTVNLSISQEYSVSGKVVGYQKSVTQIGYYQLLDSGHFVYFDKPAVLASIIRQFAGLSSSSGAQQSPIKNLVAEE